MTFKQLVKEIHGIETISDIADVSDKINKSFESGQITSDDHEVLYDIAGYYGFAKNIENLSNEGRISW